jgi:hypothetical protein
VSFFSFQRRPAPEVRILVTGCRGKSSLVRLVTAGLLACGRRARGRITGVVPREIGPEGEFQILRASGAHISEMRWWLRSLPADTDAVVLENSAVSPDFQEAAVRWLDPTLVVFTNVREDHREVWGVGTDDAARVLTRGLAPRVPVVIPSGEAAHPLVSAAADRLGCRLVRVPENPDFREGNIALALAACGASDARGEAVEAAMRSLPPDIADFRIFPLEGGELAYAFSANDVESTTRLFESLRWLPEETTLLYNGRGDRPGRDAAFESLFAERRWKGIVRIDSESAGEGDDATLLMSISGKGHVFGCGNVAGAPLRLLSLLARGSSR